MFNNNIQPVCLPEKGKKPAVGSKCYITGEIFKKKPIFLSKEVINPNYNLIYEKRRKVSKHVCKFFGFNTIPDCDFCP